MTQYDPQNIFARIIRGEIPCQKIFDSEHVLGFRDIAPKAPVHVLVCPKGPYRSMTEFSGVASPDEIVALTRAIGDIVRDLGLDQTGYRIIMNTGGDGGQEVPHLHLHILGGHPIGPMVQNPS